MSTTFQIPAAPKGNPDALRSAAGIWASMGNELSILNHDVAAAGNGTEAHWISAGATAFRSATSDNASALSALSTMSAEMASNLMQAAQIIENAQQDWKVEVQHLLQQRLGGGGGFLGGVLGGLGVLAFVAIQFVPGADVVADGAAVAEGVDAASTTADAAATASETGAAGSAVAASSSVISGIVDTAQTALEAIGNTIQNIAEQFANYASRFGLRVVDAIKGEPLTIIGRVAAGGVGNLLVSDGMKFISTGKIDTNIADNAINFAAGALPWSVPTSMLTKTLPLTEALAQAGSVAAVEAANGQPIDVEQVAITGGLGLAGGTGDAYLFHVTEEAKVLRAGLHGAVGQGAADTVKSFVTVRVSSYVTVVKSDLAAAVISVAIAKGPG